LPDILPVILISLKVNNRIVTRYEVNNKLNLELGLLAFRNRSHPKVFKNWSKVIKKAKYKTILSPGKVRVHSSVISK